MVEEDGEESYTSDCCLQFECGTEGGGEGDRVDKLNEGVTVHKYCLDAIEEQQQDKLCIVCVLYVLIVYCLLDVILDFGCYDKHAQQAQKAESQKTEEAKHDVFRY